MMSQPLGNSSLHTNNLPGWEAYFLINKLSGSVNQITGSSPNIKIPQLNCELKFTAKAYAEGEEPAVELNNPEGSDADFEGLFGGVLDGFEDFSSLVLKKILS